jgi:hypothetical protein
VNLCACGCGKPARRTWRCGHNRRIPPRYSVDPSTGCWIWLGTRNSEGYGQIRERLDGGRGRTVKAHRFMYERLVGPIPVGRQLDHLCRNRACVNPVHLEPVDNATNTQRGQLAKLTWDDVREIRASSESTASIAARYGISKANVRHVRAGETWREVA